MERKSYKWLHILLSMLLFISVSYFLIGCKSNNNNQNNNTTVQPNYFNEIAKFIETNGDHESEEIMYSLDSNQVEKYEFYITYTPKTKTLNIAGEYKNVKEFYVALPFSDNYAKVTNYLCYATTLAPKHQKTKFDLPTTPFKDISKTIKLPEFELKTQDDKIVTGTDKDSFRSELSQALSKIFAKFDSFFVEKIKNNDKNFVHTTYSYFYLPNIQAE